MNLLTVMQTGMSAIVTGCVLLAIARYLQLQDEQRAQYVVDPDEIDDWADAPREA